MYRTTDFHHRKLLHYDFSFPVMVILFGFDRFKPVLAHLFQETPKTKHNRVSILVSLVLDSFCVAICFFINRFNTDLAITSKRQ